MRAFNAIRVPGEITREKLDILRLAEECNPACRFILGADQASIFKAASTTGEAKRRSWRQVMATGM